MPSTLDELIDRRCPVVDSTIPTADQLLTLSAAARLLRPEGAPAVSPPTMWRWTTRGVRGVRLRVIRIGGRAYTCRKWLDDFVRDINAPAEPPTIEMPTQREVARARKSREKQKDDARKRLDLVLGGKAKK